MTTDLKSILARMKPQKDATLEMQGAADRLWYALACCGGASFATSLLDLMQRQDERIAGLEGVIRAQEVMTQAALEPVGVNGPPWDHHAAEDVADLILALRAENERLREAAKNALLRLEPMRHLASPASWTDAPVDAAMKILEDALLKEAS